MTASLVSSGDSKTAVNSNALEWPITSFWTMMIATYNKRTKVKKAERRSYRHGKHESLETTSDTAQWTTQKRKKYCWNYKIADQNAAANTYLFSVRFCFLAPYYTYLRPNNLFQLIFSVFFELWDQILHFFVFAVNHLRDVVRVWTSVCVL